MVLAKALEEYLAKDFQRHSSDVGERVQLSFESKEMFASARNSLVYLGDLFICLSKLVQRIFYLL